MRRWTPIESQYFIFKIASDKLAYKRELQQGEGGK
jgi:hypothetical protein